MKNEKKNNSRYEINEDELKQASGGFGYEETNIFRQDRFNFDEDECDTLKDKYGLNLTPGKIYYTGDLYKKLGTAKSGSKIREKLKDELGFWTPL